MVWAWAKHWSANFLKRRPKNSLVATKLGRRHDAPNGWPQNFSYDTMRRHGRLPYPPVSNLNYSWNSCIAYPRKWCSKAMYSNTLPASGRKVLYATGAPAWKHPPKLSQAWSRKDWPPADHLQPVSPACGRRSIYKGSSQRHSPHHQGAPGQWIAFRQVYNRYCLPKNDHRNYNADGGRLQCRWDLFWRWVQQGVAVAAKWKTLPGDEMATAAIRWILDHPEVTTVIPGASKLSQVNSNLPFPAMHPSKYGYSRRVKRYLW